MRLSPLRFAIAMLFCAGCATTSSTSGAGSSSAPEAGDRAESDGVDFTLGGCWKANRNDVICEYLGVSRGADRAVKLRGCGGGGHLAFDDKGNQYKSGKISFGGGHANCNGSKFLADAPVRVTVEFNNIASDASSFASLAFAKARFGSIPFQPALSETGAPPSSTFAAPQIETVARTESDGVLFTLVGCSRVSPSEIRCEYTGLSPKIDRRVVLRGCGGGGQLAYDDRGNQYTKSKISFGGAHANCNGSTFLSDTPVRVTVDFTNVATDASAFTSLSFAKARFTGITLSSLPESTATAEAPAESTAEQVP
jgi:hypothetical protein